MEEIYIIQGHGNSIVDVRDAQTDPITFSDVHNIPKNVNLILPAERTHILKGALIHDVMHNIELEKQQILKDGIRVHNTYEELEFYNELTSDIRSLKELPEFKSLRKEEQNQQIVRSIEFYKRRLIYYISKFYKSVSPRHFTHNVPIIRTRGIYTDMNIFFDGMSPTHLKSINDGIYKLNPDNGKLDDITDECRVTSLTTEMIETKKQDYEDRGYIIAGTSETLRRFSQTEPTVDEVDKIISITPYQNIKLSTIINNIEELSTNNKTIIVIGCRSIGDKINFPSPRSHFFQKYLKYKNKYLELLHNNSTKNKSKY